MMNTSYRNFFQWYKDSQLVSISFCLSVCAHLLVDTAISFYNFLLFFIFLVSFSLAHGRQITFGGFCRDNLDSNNALENSLIAKEKLISELNLELHNIETTLSNEREEHMNDVKKFTAMLNEKVMFLYAKNYKDHIHLIFYSL